MARSARAIKKKRQRQRLLIIGGCAVALVLIAGTVAFSLDSTHRPSGCVIGDVSKSTREAREEYLEEFSRFATAIGTEGSGNLCVILAAADPIAEGLPRSSFVGPDPETKESVDERASIEEKVINATDDFSNLLADPEVEERGSALVEAATVAAEALDPGDRLLYLSDGLQWTREVGHLIEMDLTPASTAALLARLDREGYVPDLHGIEVSFPYMFFHPGGLDENTVKVRRFWDAWAEWTDAELTVREPQ